MIKILVVNISKLRTIFGVSRILILGFMKFIVIGVIIEIFD